MTTIRQLQQARALLTHAAGSMESIRDLTRAGSRKMLIGPRRVEWTAGAGDAYRAILDSALRDVTDAAELVQGAEFRRTAYINGWNNTSGHIQTAADELAALRVSAATAEHPPGGAAWWSTYGEPSTSLHGAITVLGRLRSAAEDMEQEIILIDARAGSAERLALISQTVESALAAMDATGATAARTGMTEADGRLVGRVVHTVADGQPA